MVTAVKMSTVGTETVYEYVGKSGDKKPISANGSKFVEMDTGKEYFFDGDEKGWFIQSDKYLESIEIETAPTKTAYYVGDKFDATGLKVKAYYTDKSSTEAENVEIVAPEALAIDSEVKAKYVENGRTRYADIEIEIKPNEATDEESFIDIVSNGSIVVLNNDITVESQLSLSNDFTFDLNGHSLNTTIDDQYLINANGAKVTITGNGEINSKMRIGKAVGGGEIIIENGVFTSSNDKAFDAVGEGSKVTFNDGKIYAVEGGLMAFDGAGIEMNGGSITMVDNFGIGTNGTGGRGKNTIVMNDGYIEAHIISDGFEAIGVYIANDDTFIMNGGEIYSINGAGLVMRGGTVELNGGKIRCTGEEGGGGYVGDKKKVMSQSAVIYDEASNYPGKEGMNLTINGGTFVGFDHSVEVLSTEANPQVSVNGGAFIPVYVPVDNQ